MKNFSAIMSIKYPKISIVTPNYNQANFLEETIQSVLSQNYPNLEYIIIDGGSDDGSIDIIKKYEKNLFYWVSEPDSGMYHAIQKGFERSSGEIMAWINSDDMYHRNSFFTIAEIFTSFEQVLWLTGHNTNFDERGRTIDGRSSYTHSRYNMFLNPSEHIQQESTFWSRKLWEKVGATMDLDLRYAGDFELWMRFFRFEKLYITDALIGGFRFRKNQTTQVYMAQYNDECKEVLKREEKLLTFYDRCNLKEIKELEHTLRERPLNSHSRNKLVRRIGTISNSTQKIRFDVENQKFILKDGVLTRSTLNKIMNKKRENLEDFLDMVKTKHDYYPEVILDIGVADGTPSLYEAFPYSHFILFEALEEFLPSMLKLKDKLDAVDIEICALGAENTEVEFNVHPDLMGSSLYSEDEESDVNGYKRKVKVKTLDSFSKKYGLDDRSILLKIDVQGAELDVLRGASTLLEKIDIVVLEVSLFNFFDNKIEFFDVVSYMNSHDYVVYDIFGFLNRPLDGSLAQVDLAFVKRDSVFRMKQYFAMSDQRTILNDNKEVFEDNMVDNSASFDFSRQFNTFYECIESLKKSGFRYLIYGAGTIGRTVYELMKDSIVTSVDRSNARVQNDVIASEVYAIENIKNINFDKVIITVLGREKEIKEMLIKEYGIKSEDIVMLEV